MTIPAHRSLAAMMALTLTLALWSPTLDGASAPNTAAAPMQPLVVAAATAPVLM